MSPLPNDAALAALGWAVVGSGRPEGYALHASSPVPSSHVVGAAAIGKKIYVVGGYQQGGLGSCLNQNSEYDLSTGTWTPRQPLSSGGGARYGHAVVARGGKVYVFGGYCAAGISSADVYDPVQNSWTSVAPIPGHNHYGAAVGILGDGKLHLVAGWNHISGNRTTTDHHVYDFAQDSWTTAAPIPGARYHAASGVLPDGRMIVAGGHSGGGGGCLSDAYIYSPSADSWTPIAAMPTALHVHAGAVLGGRLHTFMGNNCTSQNSYHYVYDPATDVWTSGMGLPYTAYAPAVAQLPGSAFISSGWNGPGVTTTYEYLSPLFLYAKQ